MKQNKFDLKIKLLYSELVKTFNYTSSNVLIILDLLKRGSLNELIINMNDCITITNTSCLPITQKGYLTSQEQLIMLLKNLIYKFRTDFYFIDCKIINLIELVLFNNKYSKYLLCKKYNYIKYFNSNYQKTISYHFYNNLKILYSNSKTIQSFIQFKDFSISDFNNNYKIIYKSLIELAFFNIENPKLYYLFFKIDSFNKCNNSNNYFYYTKIIEEIIENYYIKINIIYILVFK